MFKCCDTLQVLLYLPLIDIFQSHSHVQLFATPWTIAHQASLSFTISWILLKIMPIEQIMPTVKHFILCHTHPHLLTNLPSISVFSNDLALCIRWPMYCNFSISPSNEQSVLISFRTDWFDLFAVQGTQESSPEPVLKHQLFGIHPSSLFRSHIHVGLLGKTIPWLYGPLPTKWCLWLHMLSRFVIAFPPRSKCLLTWWLQSPCTVILELKKIKICHSFLCVLIYLLLSI